MGEPKSATPPQTNGGVKQKPTSLNLSSSTAFYLNFNGRANLNDRHLQEITAGVGGRCGSRFQPTSPKLSINENTFTHLPTTPKLHSISTAPPVSGLQPWNISSELEDLDSTPPPPPAPSHPSTPLRSKLHNEHHQQQQQHQQQHNNLQSPAINQLPSRSPNHNGFSLYTPPAPIPTSGTNKICSTPNGISQPAPTRRPHSIAAPPYNLANLHAISQFAGRAASTSTTSSAPATQSYGPSLSGTPTSHSSIIGVQRRAHSTANTPVSLSNGHQEPIPTDGNLGNSARSAIPPQSLWNGQFQQRLPRRPHSIASTPVATSTSLSGPMSTPRTPAEPIQWGASGMVLHQPVPRRAYASTLPHPQPPTPTSQSPSLTSLTNLGNSNTWTPGSSLRARPHSIGSTPQGAPMQPASPSDSGYRSLPSAASDYQLLKSPSQTLQQSQQSQSAMRRLSLPSAQTLLRTNGPRPSPTFHGQPFRPFTCGLSPNGNPIFLGCTHLHGSNSTGSSIGSGQPSTPITSPANPLTTSQAIQQLLAQPRNGFKIVDDKVSLFIEILDTQERFAKVSDQIFLFFFRITKKLCDRKVGNFLL